MTRRVGIEVETSALHTPLTPAVPGAGTAFIAVLAERGPLDTAERVESLADYISSYGDRIGMSYDAVNVFFREGGKRAYIARVTDGTAAKAFIMLKDKSSDPGVNTIKLITRTEGALGNTYNAIVTAGTTSGCKIQVVTDSGKVLASKDNLTSPQAIVDAFAANRYVVAENQSSATASPNNIPRNLASTTFAGGSDGGTADEADVAVALELFTEELGAGAIIAPGFNTEEIIPVLRTACEAFGNRIALVGPQYGLDEDEAIAYGETVDEVGGEWVGSFWPWHSYNDGTAVRWVDPAAAAAGQRARAHADGAWQAAAAQPYATLRFITGIERSPSRAKVNALASAGVNAYTRRNGRISLRSWYALTQSVDYPSLCVRDLMNVISADVQSLLDDVTSWIPIDNKGHNTAHALGIARDYLTAYSRGGGLFEGYENGVQVDPGYVVQVGTDLETLEAQTLVIEIGVRPAPHAALVLIRLTKVGVGTPL